MEIRQVKIEELKFAEYNPREISKHDFEALKKSIQEFGFVEPIVVNQDNTVIGGHMRIRAAKELGQTEVPCFFVDIDKNKEKLLNLALNKIQGDWDEQKLSEVLFSLKEVVPEEIDIAGFTDPDIEAILQQTGGDETLPVPDVDIEGAGKQNTVVAFYCSDEADVLKILEVFESKSRMIDGKHLLRKLGL